MKVTQKQVAAYKKLAKQEWHDQAWRDARAKLPCEAISYAFASSYKECRDNRSISILASNYV